MVLNLPRRSALLGLALTAALTSGCIKRDRTVTRLAGPAPIEVAWVVDLEDAQPPVDPPQQLAREGRGVLAARNLDVDRNVAEAWGSDFDSRRVSSYRMAWLDQRAEDEGLLMLVELRPYFDNQSNGRYRWIVAVNISVAPAADPGRVVDDRFEVPVFLRFTFEGADEAMLEAKTEILRRIGRLVDAALQDPDAAWTIEDKEARRHRPRGAVAASEPALKQRRTLTLDEISEGSHDVQGPIYFVMLDRFLNGDPSNDGEGYDLEDPQGFHGGDLAGLSSGIWHLQELGVGTVWISPLTKSQWRKAGETGGFHGYWLEDPYAIDPHWGTEEQLKGLVSELHALGMSVVLDMVTNHVGYDSTLPVDRPRWFHGNGPVQDWHDPVQAESYDVHGLPDLDQDNPEVRDWLVGAARHWIDAVRPDGFRLDAVRHVSLDFWADYNQAVRQSTGPGFMLLGELFDGRPEVVADTWERGAFGQMFDFPLHYAMTDVFCREQHAGKVAAVLGLDRMYPDPSGLVTFLDNHDLPRILAVCEGDEAAVKDALSWQYAMRGLPAITYGIAAGLDGAQEPENRADFALSEVRQGMVRHLARLAWLRRTHPALMSTEQSVLAAEEDLLVVARTSGDEVVLVAWNRGPETREVRLPGHALEAVEVGTTESFLLAENVLQLPPGPVRWITLAGEGLADSLRAADVGSHTVTFEVDGFDGRALRVVGGAPELGTWQVDAGVRAEQGGVWTASAAVPAGTVLEYKLVGTTEEGEVVWEQGTNRFLHVRDDALVSHTWGAEGGPGGLE